MAEIDFEACRRYVQGKSSLAEAKAVRAWLKEPANESQAQQWLSRAVAEQETEQLPATLPAYDYPGMRARLHQQLGLPKIGVPASRRAAPGWWRWAAAVVGSLGLGGALYWQHAPPGPGAVVATTTRPQLVQCSTGYEQTRQVQLPDGSTVTLNANSTLRYAAVWPPHAPREIWLDGEAYFSVKHLPSHQRFRVHTTGNFDVEVLGTKFTVYRRHAQERVVLLSGKVRVDFHNRQQPVVILKPGELLQTADSMPAQMLRKVVQAPAYAAFTVNKLVFDDTPIAELATQLHDTYGIDVVVRDPALLKQTITGTVPTGDLDLLCQAMQSTFGIRVERQPQRILLFPL